MRDRLVRHPQQGLGPRRLLLARGCYRLHQLGGLCGMVDLYCSTGGAAFTLRLFAELVGKRIQCPDIQLAIDLGRLPQCLHAVGIKYGLLE